jgi:hypothetical protein
MKLGLLLIGFLIIPWVYAIETSVYVEFPNRLEEHCYDVPFGTSAKQVLEMANYSIGFKFSGGFLNSIDNYSCDENSCWFFYYNNIYSNYGIKQYDIKNKTILYFGYYKYGKDFKPVRSPKNVSFYQNCDNSVAVKGKKPFIWLLIIPIVWVLYRFYKK